MSIHHKMQKDGDIHILEFESISGRETAVMVLENGDHDLGPAKKGVAFMVVAGTAEINGRKYEPSSLKDLVSNWAVIQRGQEVKISTSGPAVIYCSSDPD